MKKVVNSQMSHSSPNDSLTWYLPVRSSVSHYLLISPRIRVNQELLIND